MSEEAGIRYLIQDVYVDVGEGDEAHEEEDDVDVSWNPIS